MNKKLFYVIFIIVILVINLWVSDTTYADVILDSDSAPVDSVINDFSDFEDELYETDGPVPIGDGVIWTAEYDGWIGDMAFGLRENGLWDWDRVGFAALNAISSSMLFTFDTPMQFAGGLLNYAPQKDYKEEPRIEVIGVNGEVLESYSMDIKTPGERNTGQFMGILRDQPDIAAFRYIARYGVFDNLTYDNPPIPEPATYTFLLGIITCIMMVKTRRG